MSLPTVRLGDVIELAYGRPLADSERSDVGSVPVFGANGVKAYTECFLFKHPTVIVGRKGSVGELHFCDGPSWALDVAYYVVHDEARADLRFLYWQMKTLDLPSFAKGVKPGLNRNEVYNLNIALPSKAEQRRIVALLDEATQHIAALESAYAQTETKYAELASSALEAALTTVSCDRVERLGEICEIEIGRTPPRADPRQWDQDESSNNVWVSIADMTAVSGGVISSSKERISDLAAASGRLVRAGTLLMSFKLSIGKLAITGCDLYTNEAIAALCLPTNSRVSQRYLYHYLSSVDWMAEARGNEKVKGATLNKAKLKELRVPVPTFEDQVRISTHIDNLKIEIERGMTSARRRLERVRDLRQSMLEAAFRGDL